MAWKEVSFSPEDDVLFEREKVSRSEGLKFEMNDTRERLFVLFSTDSLFLTAIEVFLKYEIGGHWFNDIFPVSKRKDSLADDNLARYVCQFFNKGIGECVKVVKESFGVARVVWLKERIYCDSISENRVVGIIDFCNAVNGNVVLQATLNK